MNLQQVIITHLQNAGFAVEAPPSPATLRIDDDAIACGLCGGDLEYVEYRPTRIKVRRCEDGAIVVASDDELRDEHPERTVIECEDCGNAMTLRGLNIVFDSRQ